VSLCVHEDIRGREGYIATFIVISELDGSGPFTHFTGHFILGTLWIGGWVGLGQIYNNLEKKYFVPAGNRATTISLSSLASIQTEISRIQILTVFC
jgi:hypothetical protein